MGLDVGIEASIRILKTLAKSLEDLGWKRTLGCRSAHDRETVALESLSLVLLEPIRDRIAVHAKQVSGLLLRSDDPFLEPYQDRKSLVVVGFGRDPLQRLELLERLPDRWRSHSPPPLPIDPFHSSQSTAQPL